MTPRCPSWASADMFSLNLLGITILVPRRINFPITHSSLHIEIYCLYWSPFQFPFSLHCCNSKNFFLEKIKKQLQDTECDSHNGRDTDSENNNNRYSNSDRVRDKDRDSDSDRVSVSQSDSDYDHESDSDSGCESDRDRAKERYRRIDSKSGSDSSTMTVRVTSAAETVNVRDSTA